METDFHDRIILHYTNTNCTTIVGIVMGMVVVREQERKEFAESDDY